MDRGQLFLFSLKPGHVAATELRAPEYAGWQLRRTDLTSKHELYAVEPVNQRQTSDDVTMKPKLIGSRIFPASTASFNIAVATDTDNNFNVYR